MQLIMSGRFEEADGPPAAEAASANYKPKSSRTVERNAPQRQRSTEDLIEQFSSPSSAPKKKEAAFSTIDSVGGRGNGYEEGNKLRPASSVDSSLQSSLDASKREEEAEKAASKEKKQKQKRAFIPAQLFGTNKRALEERVRRASEEGEPPPLPVGMEEFEARVRAKGRKHPGPKEKRKSARSFGKSSGRVDPDDFLDDEEEVVSGATKPGVVRSDSKTKDDFEQRIMRKSQSGGGAAGAAVSASARRGSSGFDDRLARKMSGAGESSASSDRRGSGGSFDDRLKRKMSTASDGDGQSKERATVGATSVGSEHDDRLLWRKMDGSVRDSVSGASGAGHGHGGKLSDSMNSLDSFEARLQQKSVVGQDAKGSKSKRKKGKKGRKGTSSHAEAAASGLTGSDRRREAIAAVMADESLNPSERNQRLSEAMARDYDDIERNDSGPMDPSESEREANMALEAKIANKLRLKRDMNAEHRDLRDEYDREGSRRNAGNGLHDDDDGLERARTTRSLFVSESGRRIRESEEGPGDVGYGSLPLPEEHFSQDQLDNGAASPLEPTLVQDESDENYGLAVATAIAEDDEPDYVYNAVEYDPFAKPPLHRNRRFRVYTYFALVLIAIMVVLVVVYVTSASKGDEVVNEFVDYQAAPTAAPTPAPITDREASGVIEQLEGGVLLDGEAFVGMERGDPRLLALDWILHLDLMQLVSDDPNLYQRFALAVLAYALDHRAWYHCGDPGVNYTESVCTIAWDENTTETHGMWLSSTPECGWYGVMCSGDGVVRGIDLNQNDLIGMLPREISALSSLQLLALPYNCLYGPIPPELGKLRHLLSLELHDNGLSGELPKQLYDLEKLQLLNLANQWGVQRECNATNGRVIDINYKMGGLARPFEENAGLNGALGPEIGVWRSMKGLYLNKNSFDGVLSEEIGNMRYLRFLSVEDNFIAGIIPTTITKLRNLRYLQLGENFLLSSLPDELGRLTDLEILTVNGNSMYGALPDGLYQLTKLQYLRLDETLSGQAPWLVDPDEGFTGSLSTQIGGLKDLRWLLLSNNPLTGTIPTEIGLCEKLERMRVHQTNIGGTMPMEVCMLRDKELNHEGGKGVLYADCRPTNRTGDPQLKCDCCSDCCDHVTGVCIADD